MPETKCYAQVRGSAVRVTGLDRKGSIPDTIQFAVSKSIAKVTINEVTESGSSQTFVSEQNDNDTRLRLLQSDETVRYTVDMDFLRVDPGILYLLTGTPLVRKRPGSGFGKDFFALSSFGGDDTLGVGEGFGGDMFGSDSFGDESGGIDDSEVVGFDSNTRLSPSSFALEVWSKLAGEACLPSGGAVVGFGDGGYGLGVGFGGSSDVRTNYGYTVFPHLRGGRLSGFSFANGLVSFNIIGAQTRRAPRWAVGPFDLEGTNERLVQPVSRNTMYRQMLTTALPPIESDGIQETDDIIRGGSATVTSDDVIEGGDASTTSPWIIYGGQAV